MNIKIFTLTKNKINTELEAFERKSAEIKEKKEEIRKMYSQEYAIDKVTALDEQYSQLITETSQKVKAIFSDIVKSAKNVITAFYTMPINSDLKATLELVEKTDLTPYELFQWLKTLKMNPLAFRFLKDKIDYDKILNNLDAFATEEAEEFKKMLDQLNGVKTLDEYIFELNELVSSFDNSVDTVIQNIIQKYKGANTTADEINFDIDRKLLDTYVDDLKELLKELNGLVEGEKTL